jgi:formate-dependent nitrite reductase membrane component NrfD
MNYELDMARHSHLVDPQLHVWGWEIPVYLFLGGLAAGIMVLTALMLARPGERSRAMRWLPFATPILVSVGMVALFLDLEHKAFVWRFYLAFRWTSPMSWGAWILLLVYPASLLTALAALADDQAEWLAARAGPLGGALRSLRAYALPRAAWLGKASVAVGVGLGVYTGILLSTLGARALWSSALLGPLFLVSGLSTGAALFLLFRISDEERKFLVGWDMLAIGLEVTLLLLFLAGLATSGAEGKAAAGLLLGGPYTAQFWTVVVIGGLLAPALLEALEARFHLRVTVVAPLLVLTGGFALRWILVAAGPV